MSRQRHDPVKAERLDHIYEHLPKLECKGLCQESCGPIVQAQSMTEQELLRLQDAGGRRTGRMRRRPEVCPYLSAEGRCDVYEVRPLMCRLWGVVELLRCPHGCVPEQWLSDPDGKQLLARAQLIGGELPHSALYGTGTQRDPAVLQRVVVKGEPGE